MTTLVSLFFGALLAATILPFSSEIMLVTALKAGEVSTGALVFIATLGNVTGALINWFLGGWLLHLADHKYFPFNQEQIDRAAKRFNKYGVWSLLLAWLPVIGDPLTFIAGTLKTPLPVFLFLVTIGKAARYAFIGWAV